MKPHILFIDDHQQWRMGIKQLLERDYQITLSKNYKESVNIIKNKEFDLIILDIRLNDKDMFDLQGIKLLREIKAKKPNQAIVVFSANHDEIKEEISLPHNDCWILRKPILNIKKFKINIDKILHKKQVNMII